MFEAIILGIVQGLTEFLPVSSTAHLILLPWIFNWRGEVDTLTFDIALHGGTLLALLVCFYKDWIELFLRKRKLLIYIIAGSLPAGIAGLLLNNFAEQHLRSPLLISIMLILVGFIMLASERICKYRNQDSINLSDSFFIGIAQAFAIIPGVSRSGITISAGLFKGLQRDVAARFSFLLSTPIIAGALLLHVRKAITNYEAYNIHLFLWGFIASFLTGYIAIKFLLNFLKKYPLNIFVYYRFVIAIVIIAGIWLKA